MKHKSAHHMQSAARQSRVFRRTLPLVALVAVTLFGSSGFRVLPDIDRANHKNLPTYNNAGLNSAAVTPTDFTPVPKLSAGLAHHVKGVHYAIVLKRESALFAGVDTGGASRKATASIVEQASDWLTRQSPAKTKIYVSTNATLVNHFHRYAADTAAHLGVSSGIILGDVQREFPGVK